MPETTKEEDNSKKKGQKTRSGRAKKHQHQKEMWFLPETGIYPLGSRKLLYHLPAAGPSCFLSNFSFMRNGRAIFFRSVQLGIFGGIGYIAPVFDVLRELHFTFQTRENPRAVF